MMLRLSPLSFSVMEILPTEYFFNLKDKEISEDFATKREILEYTFNAYQEDGEERREAYAVLPMATCIRIEIKSTKEEIDSWIKQNKQKELFLCKLLTESI